MKKIYYLIAIVLATGVICGGCGSKTKTDALIEHGLSYMQDGNYESARETLVDAADLFTNSVTAHYNLGLVCWKLGDNDAAIAALTKAVDLSDSSDPRPLELLAYVMIDSGNALGAGKVLSNVEEQTASSLTIMALASERAGSSDLARSYLGQALGVDKNYPPALYNLALLHRDAFNNSREALAYYKRFQAVAPNDIRADKSLQAFIGQQRLATSAQRPAPSAQRPAPSAQRPAPSDPKLVDKLLKKAELALGRDEADIALITLKTAVRQHPDSADAVWQLAELYGENLGNKEKANELHKKFVVMFPNDKRSDVARKKVIAASAVITPKPPRSAKEETGETYFRAGLEYYKSQKWNEAIIAYTKGLKLEPKSSRIAYNLGLAYKANGALSKAAKAFTLSLRILPDKPNALYMLGLTEMERNHNDLALVRLNRLLRIKPDFAKAHHLLGLIYCEENRPDMTVMHFESFIHLAPTDRNATQAKVWLEQNQGKRE